MIPTLGRHHVVSLVQAGLAFAVASLLAAASSDAQSLRLTRSSVLSDAAEGMGNVHGYEAQVLLPIRATRVSARAAVAFGRGEIDRVFVTFRANPTTASTAYVQLNERSMTLFSIGVGGELLQSRRAQAQISTDLLLGATRFSDDASTGRDTRGLRGARISLDGTWWVTARSPFGVHAAGSMGMLKPTGTSACSGCRGVLSDKAFRASRLAAGIAIRRPGR